METTPYNSSTLGEKWFQSIPVEKIGRIIELSEEAIYWDRTRQLLEAAKDIGRLIGNRREQRIVESVQDVGEWAGKIYRPESISTALFDSANTLSSNPFGQFPGQQSSKSLKVWSMIGVNTSMLALMI